MVVDLFSQKDRAYLEAILHVEARFDHERQAYRLEIICSHPLPPTWIGQLAITLIGGDQRREFSCEPDTWTGLGDSHCSAMLQPASGDSLPGPSAATYPLTPFEEVVLTRGDQSKTFQNETSLRRFYERLSS